MTSAPNTYLGKCADATGAVVAMLVGAAGLREGADSYCATGRPFPIVTPLDQPELWLSSPVEPVAGLLNGLRMLGAEAEYLSLPDDPDDQSQFWRIVTSWVDSGPVAFGPLDKLRLWDRLEDRYHRGDGYFIVLVGRGPTGELFVHDPEGCPFALRRPEELAGAALQVQGTSAIRSTPGKRFRNCSFAVLELGIAERAQVATRTGAGGAGIVALADRVGGGLKSREMVALRIGIAARGVSLARINTLLTDAGIPHGLDGYRHACADILYALDRRDTHATITGLAAAAQFEGGLDELLGTALGRMKGKVA